MPKFNIEWKVQPHGDVVTVDEGILTVAGTIVMPLGKFPRRMTVIALAGGGTAVWSAVPIDEAGMATIDALGQPAFLIVPNAGHRLDIRPWKDRYPDAKVLTPPGAREAVEEAVPVDATEDLIHDPAITFHRVPGTKADEFALTVKRGDGTTLILNDILANVRHPDGIGATVMAWLFGFGLKRPRTSRPVRLFFVTDTAAVARQFRAWAAIPDLRRIIVSHGDVIEDDPAGALRKAAADLE